MKRLIALILALIMALPLFAACNTGENPPKEEGNGDPEITTEDPVTDETTPAPAPEAEIPEDAHYPDTTFRVLSRVSDLPTGWGNYDIVYDESSELVVTEIQNAIRLRNDALFDRLGVTVQQIATTKDVYSDAYLSLALGTDEYDMILPSISDAGRLAQEGYLLSMDELTYVDTEKPWYDQRCFDQLAINGKNYFFFSDITVVNLDAIWLYYFNHKVVEKYALETPYELLADYKWTIDKLVDMCSLVTNDADGTPTLDDEWGIVGHDYILTSLYHGTGEHIAVTNDRGEIEITMDSERIYTFISKALTLHQYWARYPLEVTKFVNNSAQYGFTVSGGHYETMLDAFTANKILFMGEVLASARDLTAIDSDMDVGILPTPMLEEAQREYFTPVNDIAAVSCIPSTVADPVATSVIIEFWAAESSETLMPAYYDQAQKSRFSKDEISPDVIDLIFDARSYDIGASYAWGDLEVRLAAMLWDQDNGFESLYDSYGPAAEAALELFLEDFVE